MNPTTERVYKTICNLAGPQGIKISHAELSQETGIPVRTLIRHIKRLEPKSEANPKGLGLIHVERGAKLSKVRNTYFPEKWHTCVPERHSVDSDYDSKDPEPIESLQESSISGTESISNSQPSAKTAHKRVTMQGLTPSTQRDWEAQYGVDRVGEVIAECNARNLGPGFALKNLRGEMDFFERPATQQPQTDWINTGPEPPQEDDMHAHAKPGDDDYLEYWQEVDTAWNTWRDSLRPGDKPDDEDVKWFDTSMRGQRWPSDWELIAVDDDTWIIGTNGQPSADQANRFWTEILPSRIYAPNPPSAVRFVPLPEHWHRNARFWADCPRLYEGFWQPRNPTPAPEDKPAKMVK